jgi:integrase
MMDVWRRDQLAPPTVQTYLSFLRGLAGWIGKPGMVQRPGAYGWDRSEYERTGIAQRDKTWTGAGIDIDPLIAQVCAFDHHVGAALRLIRAFGLRRKEAVMMRPHACVVPFSATGLPLTRKKAETYLWVCQGSKGGRPRHVPITTAEQEEALAFAQAVAGGGDAHVSDPDRQLHQNLNHFSYVLRRFGLSLKDRGATAHGLRHELFVQVWREQTGTEPPARGAGRAPKEREDAARQDIAELAGHGRKRAAGAYIGSPRHRVIPCPASVGPPPQSFGRADGKANGPAHDVE